MISYDVKCDNGHIFEGWFKSSSAFDDQQARGLINCPICSSTAVQKAIMAPNIGRKSNQQMGKVTDNQTINAADSGKETPKNLPVAHDPAPSPAKKPAQAAQETVQLSGEQLAKLKKVMTNLAEAQKKALEKSDWVGRDFAPTARAIYYGEEEERPIYGESSPDEARQLLEEGIDIAPLPFPVIPPKSQN